MLSRVRALAKALSARLRSFGLSYPPRSRRTPSTSIRAYQTARLPVPANRAIAVRYSSTAPRTMRSWLLAEYPLLTAAISMLTASRLTSHSQGPGRVSSKSLRSNTSRRSGEANTPKFDRWASPQHWTVRPERGVRARSSGHDHGRTAVEREWGHEHPAVADGHELGHARGRLPLEHRQRIGPAGGRLEPRVTRARSLGPRRPAARHPLADGQARSPRRGARLRGRSRALPSWGSRGGRHGHETLRAARRRPWCKHHGRRPGGRQ